MAAAQKLTKAAALTALAAALALAAACRAAHSAPMLPTWVYVTGAGPELRLLDALDLRVAGTMPLPGDATAMAWDRAHDRLWLAMATGPASGRLVALAAGSMRRRQARTLGFRPQALLAGADALWVAGAGAANGALARLDYKSGRWRQAAFGGDLVALAVAPGGRIVAADGGGRALFIVDAKTLAVPARVPLAAAPSAVVALPYGAKAFALCPAIGQVAAVDLARAGVLTYLQVGADPRAMALKPDGGELYVSSFAAGTISAIDTGANQVTDTMLAGRQPIGLAVSPDNQWLFAANSGDNTVAAISIYDRKVVATIPVGLGPAALALGDDGALLFVEDRGSSDIGVIRTGPRNLLSLLPAAASPTLMLVAGGQPPRENSN